jgi:ribosomal protein S18 acetylase RimI-like enzyme
LPSRWIKPRFSESDDEIGLSALVDDGWRKLALTCPAQDAQRVALKQNTEMVMPIVYALEPGLSAQEFQSVLVASTLAERRPANDLDRLQQMLGHADIIVTARDAGRLVGISRAISDFSYCCYLSDLAVDVAYQHQGIGKQLIEETRRKAGDGATLILVAAPAAESYYPSIGMKHLASCWAIPRAR